VKAFWIAAVFLVLVLLTGCGTTHYFLPAKPIESTKWQVSLNWHYDLNGFSKPNLIPDVNAYLGVGKDMNFGFGAQFPFFVSHLTLAKYWDKDKDWWSAYFHLNSPISTTRSPLFELGGTYSTFDHSVYQSYGFGIATGQLAAWDLTDSAGISHRIIPYVNYAVGGRDFAFSYYHYHGRSKIQLNEALAGFLNQNDTLYVFEAGTIDSIGYSEGVYYAIQRRWIIYTSEKNHVFYSFPEYADDFVNNEREFQSWLGDKYDLIHDGTHSYSFRFSAIIDMDAVIAKWKAGERVVITKVPPEFKDRIEHYNSFLKDHSFGVAVFTH